MHSPKLWLEQLSQLCRYRPCYFESILSQIPEGYVRVPVGRGIMVLRPSFKAGPLAWMAGQVNVELTKARVSKSLAY
jgi:hypothetical protein